MDIVSFDLKCRLQRETFANKRHLLDIKVYSQIFVLVFLLRLQLVKVYPRVTLASASTLSGSVTRTLRGGEGLPKMFCLVASSLGHLSSQWSIACGSSLQRGHRGSVEGRGDWRWLSAVECGRLAGAQGEPNSLGC